MVEPRKLLNLKQFSLIIDGVSLCDPASETFFGANRMFRAIEIPSADEGFYAVKNVPHGDIRTKWYYSKTTGEWRNIYIYIALPVMTTTLIKNIRCFTYSMEEAKISVAGQIRD